MGLAAAWQVPRAVDGLVVAQVAFVSDRLDGEPGWIVHLMGSSRALAGRHATEFEAMAAAEAALWPDGAPGS